MDTGREGIISVIIYRQYPVRCFRSSIDMEVIYIRRKKTAFSLVLLLSLLAIAACIYYHRHAPDRMAENILISITTDSDIESLFTGAPDLEPELFLEHCTQRYRPDLTEEAFHMAVQDGTFLTFFRSNLKGGNLKSSDIKVERLQALPDDISFFGVVNAVYSSADGSSYTQTWNAKIRVGRVEGSWKIQYLSMKFVR